MRINKDDYKQLVLTEIRHLRETDTQPVKIYFGESTTTAKQLKVMSRQYGVDTRRLVESAVQLMFTCLLTPVDNISESEGVKHE